MSDFDVVVGELLLTKMDPEVAPKVAALALRIKEAHDAELATIRAHIEGLEANIRSLSPLNYEERCRLRDAEARVRELEADAGRYWSRVEEAHGNG